MDVQLKMWMHLESPVLHPFALNRDVMSEFFRRFCPRIHAVIGSLVMVSQARVSAIGSAVYALEWRAFVVQLQPLRLLYAFLVRTDDVVLGLESLDPIGGLHVLHALSIICKR